MSKEKPCESSLSSDKEEEDSPGPRRTEVFPCFTKLTLNEFLVELVCSEWFQTPSEENGLVQPNYIHNNVEISGAVKWVEQANTLWLRVLERNVKRRSAGA
jgi:hypothetical protein